MRVGGYWRKLKIKKLENAKQTAFKEKVASEKLTTMKLSDIAQIDAQFVMMSVMYKTLECEDYKIKNI